MKILEFAIDLIRGSRWLILILSQLYCAIIIGGVIASVIDESWGLIVGFCIVIMILNYGVKVIPEGIKYDFQLVIRQKLVIVIYLTIAVIAPANN